MTDSLAADALWMKEAVAEAEKARAQEEVPVGALLVRDGQIIGRGHNVTEQQRDPTGHAEMVAIRQAAVTAESRRLLDATLYVTLEPCAMCAGAIVLCRIQRLVFGAYDPKAGACGTLRNVVQDPRLNHTCQVIGGVLHSECADLLQSFFGGLRDRRSK